MHRRVWPLLLVSCGRLDFGAPPPQLVVHYPMDDDPQSGTVSATPAAYSTTCVTCPLPAAGVHDGGYQFDGTAHFELPIRGVVGSAPYTVALWANIPDLGTNAMRMAMVARPMSAASDLDVFNLVVLDAALTIGYETTDGDIVYLRARAAPAAWHHLAATWDGTEKRLYVDGALAVHAAANIISTLEYPMQVGLDVDRGIPLYPLVGTLDDLEIYSGALSDAEIAALATP